MLSSEDASYENKPGFHEFTLAVMIILLFVIPSLHGTTNKIGQALFLNPTPFLIQNGSYATDGAYWRGASFSFHFTCTNTGNVINHNVVMKASDPWLTGQTSYSVGDIGPGETRTVQFTGRVPDDAPIDDAHTIVDECITQTPLLYSSSAWVIYVAPAPLPPTNPLEPPNPPPLEETPICDSKQDPRCAMFGIICPPDLPVTEDEYPDICAKYLHGVGYIANPFYLDFFHVRFGPAHCVIATAAYGSPMAPEVVYMRTVRDGMIGSTPMGRVLRDAFDLWYYSWAPPVAEWISGSESLRAVFRVLLVPIVLIVHVTAFIFSGLGRGDLGAVVSFFVAAILSIGTYILIPAVLLIRGFRWLGRRISMKRLNRRISPSRVL
jgi:hypothetical protein